MLLLAPYGRSAAIRDFKMPRGWWQPERQKSSWLNKQNNNSALAWISSDYFESLLLPQNCWEEKTSQSNRINFRLTARDHAFLHISLSSLHGYDGKMPNFTLYRGRKQATANFFFSFWTSNLKCSAKSFMFISFTLHVYFTMCKFSHRKSVLFLSLRLNCVTDINGYFWGCVLKNTKRHVKSLFLPLRVFSVCLSPRLERYFSVIIEI